MCVDIISRAQEPYSHSFLVKEWLLLTKDMWLKIVRILRFKEYFSLTVKTVKTLALFTKHLNLQRAA